MSCISVKLGNKIVRLVRRVIYELYLSKALLKEESFGS